MKHLNGEVLYPEIDRISETIDKIQSELTHTRYAILELIELDEALKGEAGQAIRTFYDTVHIPFLTYFEETLLDYKEKMLEAKDNFLSYDSSPIVFIHEDLMENEVLRGLNEAENITEDLVNEANIMIRSVTDILPLSPLSMDEFAEYTKQGRRFIREVLENLYALDEKRKNALLDIHKHLEIIHNYLNSVGTLFADKEAIKNFQPIHAFMLPGFSELQKGNYISDKTVISLKPTSDNHFVREMKKEIETNKGIALGIADYGLDLAHGLYLLTLFKSQPQVAIKEISIPLALLASDPKATWSNLKQEVTDSFDCNMTNGDYTSKARYSTYTLLSVADIFLGTHGVGPTTKGVTWTSSVAKLNKFNKAPSGGLNNSFPHLEKWKPALEGENFGGYNVLHYDTLREDLLVPVKRVEEEKLIGKGTDKVVNASNVSKKSYINSRPSYGKGQVEQVWENAKDPINRKVYDPTGFEIVWDKSKPRNGQWDMGHIPGEKYSDIHELYMNNIITKNEFLEWYRDPTNYRPELPSTNRSHKYE